MKRRPQKIVPHQGLPAVTVNRSGLKEAEFAEIAAQRREKKAKEPQQFLPEHVS